MRLTQYPVAWHEQMILRMMFQPHNVCNLGSSVSESTGPLPSLLDLSSTSSLRGRRRRGGEASLLCSQEEERREEYDDDDNVDNYLDHPQASELNNGPILVGRNQSGGMGSLFFQQMRDSKTVHGGSSSSSPTFVSLGSHIVDYLRSRQPCCSSSGTAGVSSLYSFSYNMTPSAKKGQQMNYEVLIQDRLDYILMALRYGHSQEEIEARLRS